MQSYMEKDGRDMEMMFAIIKIRLRERMQDTITLLHSVLSLSMTMM